MARWMICLHLDESVYFKVLDYATTHATWLKLCNTYEKNTPSNKVFLMCKLFNLRIKDNGNVAHHINDFESTFSQMHAQQMNLDDELKLIFSLPASWDTFCMSTTLHQMEILCATSLEIFSVRNQDTRLWELASWQSSLNVQKEDKQRHGRSKQYNDSDRDGKKDASCGHSHCHGKKDIQCHFCDKYGHLKKDYYAWKREKGKGKEKASRSAHIHALEDKTKSSVKIEEINVVTHNSDFKDVLVLDYSSDMNSFTFDDAQESLCLESTVFAEILVSGEISYTWIMDFGASLHVTPPHREWFSCYKEIVDTIKLGNSYMHVILLALVAFLWCFLMACTLSLKMFVMCHS